MFLCSDLHMDASGIAVTRALRLLHVSLRVWICECCSSSKEAGCVRQH